MASRLEVQYSCQGNEGGSLREEDVLGASGILFLASNSVAAYLDTSVIANWLIYYRKRARWLSFREQDKARQSMMLFQEIIDRRYSTVFVTSVWAIAELTQSALDYRIAIRMIRDGRNPRFFQTLKQQYPLTLEEKNQIYRSLDDFLDKLQQLQVKVLMPEIIDYDDMSIFSFNYGVEAPDALHLSIAKTMGCKYFITIDERLAKAQVKEIQVMFPPTFSNLPAHKKP